MHQSVWVLSSRGNLGAPTGDLNQTAGAWNEASEAAKRQIYGLQKHRKELIVLYVDAQMLIFLSNAKDATRQYMAYASVAPIIIKFPTMV